MWKSVTLPVGKDLELDDPDLWIKIIPIGFLPNRLSREILAEMSGAQNIGEDADTAGMYIERMVKYMPAIVADWNLKDANGERIDPPSVDPQAANDLPIDVIGYIMTHGMGAEDADRDQAVGDIPLVSNNSSESDSSETSSPEVTKPENSQGNVVALKAQMEAPPLNNL